MVSSSCYPHFYPVLSSGGSVVLTNSLESDSCNHHRTRNDARIDGEIDTHGRDAHVKEERDRQFFFCSIRTCQVL